MIYPKRVNESSDEFLTIRQPRSGNSMCTRQHPNRRLYVAKSVRSRLSAVRMGLIIQAVERARMIWNGLT